MVPSYRDEIVNHGACWIAYDRQGAEVARVYFDPCDKADQARAFNEARAYIRAFWQHNREERRGLFRTKKARH